MPCFKRFPLPFKTNIPGFANFSWILSTFNVISIYNTVNIIESHRRFYVSPIGSLKIKLSFSDENHYISVSHFSLTLRCTPSLRLYQTSKKYDIVTEGWNQSKPSLNNCYCIKYSIVEFSKNVHDQIVLRSLYDQMARSLKGDKCISSRIKFIYCTRRGEKWLSTSIKPVAIICLSRS